MDRFFWIKQAILNAKNREFAAQITRELDKMWERSLSEYMVEYMTTDTGAEE